MNKKVRNRYHRRLLLDEISNKHKRLKSLNKQLASETDTLKSNVIGMKSIGISYSISFKSLSNEQYEVLRYGLNHGLATDQNTSDTVAAAESVWDQINRQSLWKETYSHMERAKNSSIGIQSNRFR